MAQYEVTDYGNGTYSIRETTWDDVGSVGGISSIVLYIAGLIGLIIMLANVADSAPAMIIFAIVAAVIYVLIPLIGLFAGGILGALGLLLRFGIILFDLVLVGLFLTVFSFSASSMQIVPIFIISMFGMYYFPFYGFYYGSEYDSGLLKGSAIAGIVLAVVGYIVLALTLTDFIAAESLGYEATAAIGYCSIAVVPTAMAICVSFGALATLIHNRHGEPNVIAALIIVVVIVAGCVFGCVGLYNKAEADYVAANQYAEAGEYYEARQIYLRLSNFRDCAERLEPVVLKDLHVGEEILFGRDSYSYPQTKYKWVVIKVEGKRALIFPTKIMQWGTDAESANSRIRYLIEDFTDEERAMLCGQTNYLLTAEEWQELVPEKYRYTLQETKYYKEMLEDKLEDYYLTFSNGYLLSGGMYIDCELITPKSERLADYTYDITGVRPAIWVYID